MLTQEQNVNSYGDGEDTCNEEERLEAFDDSTDHYRARTEENEKISSNKLG
jgi:hypothetical protein